MDNNSDQNQDPYTLLLDLVAYLCISAYFLAQGIYFKNTMGVATGSCLSACVRRHGGIERPSGYSYSQGRLYMHIYQKICRLKGSADKYEWLPYISNLYNRNV